MSVLRWYHGNSESISPWEGLGIVGLCCCIQDQSNDLDQIIPFFFFQGKKRTMHSVLLLSSKASMLWRKLCHRSWNLSAYPCRGFLPKIKWGTKCADFSVLGTSAAHQACPPQTSQEKGNCLFKEVCVSFFFFQLHDFKNTITPTPISFHLRANVLVCKQATANKHLSEIKTSQSRSVIYARSSHGGLYYFSRMKLPYLQTLFGWCLCIKVLVFSLQHHGHSSLPLIIYAFPKCAVDLISINHDKTDSATLLFSN